MMMSLINYLDLMIIKTGARQQKNHYSLTGFDRQ
jgi:hypothetical protein